MNRKQVNAEWWAVVADIHLAVCFSIVVVAAVLGTQLGSSLILQFDFLSLSLFLLATLILYFCAGARCSSSHVYMLLLSH